VPRFWNGCLAVGQPRTGACPIPGLGRTLVLEEPEKNFPPLACAWPECGTTAAKTGSVTGEIETMVPTGRIEERHLVDSPVAGDWRQDAKRIFCSSIHLRGGDIARNQALEQIQG